MLVGPDPIAHAYGGGSRTTPPLAGSVIHRFVYTTLYYLGLKLDISTGLGLK